MRRLLADVIEGAPAITPTRSARPTGGEAVSVVLAERIRGELAAEEAAA